MTRAPHTTLVKMRVAVLIYLVSTITGAEDTCPDVKIVGVGDADKLTILRGCPGTPGYPGQKGEIGALGEKGQKGDPGQPGKVGPTGQIGAKGEKGQTGQTGPSGVQGPKGDPFSPVYGAAKNCKDLRNKGVVLTGWYTIYPDGMKPLIVLCDMHTDGGGWIVFQRRVDGSVDFFQDWETYKRGFGSQLSEFWLGNEIIHQLTASGTFQLRVDLEDFEYNRTYAAYSNFKVESEKDLYRLRINNFTGGTAGNSLDYHKDMAFSTKDRDNDRSDGHCAKHWSAAWWYKACHYSHLNGQYMRGDTKGSYGGVSWQAFRGNFYSLKVSEMKFRPE